MAKIIGIEEKKRVVKAIEDKVRELKSIDAFVYSLFRTTKYAISCMDADNKRHQVNLTGVAPETLYDVLMDTRTRLADEVIDLSSKHGIELEPDEEALLQPADYTHDIQQEPVETAEEPYNPITEETTDVAPTY